MPKNRNVAAFAARSSRGAIAFTLTLCSIGVATPVHAEDAVQWRAEDGGNGHWYRAVATEISWNEARVIAIAAGGDLVSIEESGELEAIADLVLEPRRGILFPASGGWGPHIGGLEDPVDTSFVWLTGDPIDCVEVYCENTYTDQTRVQLVTTNTPIGYGYNDVGEDQRTGVSTPGFMIEWSADCNGDGIVDHGQILDGTFLDLDQNGVPDCCDAGTNCDPNLDVPVEYPTIQSAIDACPDGGTIRLAPGDYQESLVFPARNIRVLGAPEYPSTIRLTGCCGTNAIVDVRGPFNGWITFEGVTIARGPAYGFTVDRSGLRLLDCIVRNCGDAGVILHTAARGEFRRTTFTRNQGRGMYAYVNSFIDAEDCDFVENHCPCYGGGIGLHVGSGCDVRASRFVGNWAATGGAIGLSFSGSRVFTDCVFEDNEADGDPLWSTEFGGTATSVNGLFCGHSTADIGGGFVDGGGNDFRPGGCDLGCPADFSDDDVVGSADLGVLLAHYRDYAGFPQGDLNQDGELDAGDLGLLLRDWGPCPE